MQSENQPNFEKKEPILNQVKHRYLILSPSVKNGMEREANKNDFEALEEKSLGKGGFGCVWKVRHKTTKKIYAIKVINKESIVKQNLVEQTNREIEIMYQLDHPHVIKLYNHFEDDEDFCLIMQYASKGHLYSQIKKLKRLDQKTAAQYMREVISAIKYLHTKKPPIIHRDLKPENVLLDQDMRCKLADFGWSNFQTEDKDRETYCGTPEYLAPEMINKSGHNEGVDIWSIGVLLFELLTGRTPFYFKGDRNALYTAIKSIKINWPSDLNPLAKDLIGKILKEKPSQRLSLDQIINHPWFREVPAIKPVLEPYNYTEYQKLCSHLIHSNVSTAAKPEKNSNADSENHSKQRKSKVKNSNALSLKSTDLGGFESTPKDKSNQKVRKPKPNKERDDSDDEPDPHQVLGLKDIKSNHAEMNLIKIDKSKYDKDMRELKILREEIQKKDTLINELKSKLEKTETNVSALKVKNKERETMFNELDEKSTKVLKLESDLKLLKIDLDQLTQENSDLKAQKSEINNKLKELEASNRTLENKLLTSDQAKKEEIDYLQAKLTRFEEDYVGEASKTYDVDKIIKFSFDNLQELSEFTKQKFEKIEQKIIENEQNEVEFRNTYASSMDSKFNIMLEEFKMNQNKIIKEEENLLIKQQNELKKENEEFKKKLEWYKAQVKDLNQYKNKYLNTKSQLDDKDKEIKIYIDSKNVSEEKYKYVNSLINIQNEKIKILKDARDIYKNAFMESEKLFEVYVKDKKLKELINFNNNFLDPS